jgi:hypothetical protein
MKNIKIKITAILLCVVALPAFTSCDDQGYDDYDAGETPVQAMSGEWFIDITDDATGDLLVAHALHKTYNTGTGSDETMYINDQQNGWWLGGIVNINLDDLTFSVTGEENFQDPGTTFTITEGKIMRDAATSPTGATVDSIYFKATFSYDPASVLTFSGYRRTGFVEEE